jgi:prepilin-type N-terminal cleavage/methylation domain-containing protein
MKMPRSPTGRKSRRAFTLLEILVVLTIIGLLLGLAVPVYAKLVPRLHMLSASHQLLVDLRHAHSEAVTSHKTVAVSFYPSRNIYVVDDLERQSDVHFAAALETSDQQSSKEKTILHFYADGSASSGQISLFDANFRTNIHIDGLTGEAALYEK